MKRFIFLIPIALLLFSSCEKDLKVDAAPDFEVAVATPSVRAGEEVLFNMSGYADIIAMYTGEPGRDYNFKDGRVIEFSYKGATMSFSSGVTGGTQEDQLRVLISNNFSGDYSSLSAIKSATWTDITDSLTLATNAAFVSAGVLDISRFTEAGGPVYVAFKYLTRPQLENGEVRTWMIENFTVNSIEKYNNNSLQIVNQLFAGFTIVDEDPENTPSRSTKTTTRLSLRGNAYENPDDPKYDPTNPIYDPNNPIYDPTHPDYDPTREVPVYEPYDPNNPYNDPTRETWAVSAPIYTDKVDLGPDRPIGIKGIRNPKLVEYAYTFANPGNYEVVFVASNNTIHDKKEIVQKVNVTVNP